MAHTYASLLVHCVFSTKERQPLIDTEMQSRVWAFMGGIARANKFKALAIGGTRDHVHALLSLPASMAVAKACPVDQGKALPSGSTTNYRKGHSRGKRPMELLPL